jgi:hypothetical protein
MKNDSFISNFHINFIGIHPVLPLLFHRYCLKLSLFIRSKIVFFLPKAHLSFRFVIVTTVLGTYFILHIIYFFILCITAITDKNDADFDEYTAREMEKKGFPNGRKSDRVDPRSLRNGGGANRFANSRCKPPGMSV